MQGPTKLIPVSLLETNYRQEFNKSLHYLSLGVRNIEELLDQMGDKEQESNGKYVMPVPMVEIRQNLFLKHDVQELLDRHHGEIAFNSFKHLYEDHFKMKLDYLYYGLTNLENLCEILKDILVVREAKHSGAKVINAKSMIYNLRKRKK
ncbi:calcium-transporting ATPase 2, plasma membrane-type-like protein [Tanacetum coccineum]